MQMTPSAQTILPGWVRINHWLNAIAVWIMVQSGWQIYNASPLWKFRFPAAWTLGGWLGGGILWHFAAMWLLVINGALYLVLNLFSGRIQRQFLPLSVRALITDLADAMRLRLRHADLRHYNAVQKAAYLLVWLDTLILVLSGLVLWKSVQFPLLRALLGNYEVARRVHFVAMSVLVAFIVLHLIMVVCVPRTLVVMIRGR